MPGSLAGMPAHPHLDADDDVAVLVGDLDRLAHRQEPEIAAFADHDPPREGEDAGKGDVEIGEDARFAPLDHVLAEAEEVAGPGAAGIDRGGHAARPGEVVGIDAERGSAPIDVGMEVDEAGHHDLAGNVAHVVRGGISLRTHACHLAAGEGNVGDRVDVL